MKYLKAFLLIFAFWVISVSVLACLFCGSRSDPAFVTIVSFSIGTLFGMGIGLVEIKLKGD